MRMPMVRRRSCCRRRGVSAVAGSRKVYGPGRAGLDQAELPVLKLGEAADIGKVAAHQCEMMMTVGVADAPHALERRLVADVAAERVARIGRIGDDAARAHDRRPRGG